MKKVIFTLLLFTAGIFCTNAQFKPIPQDQVSSEVLSRIKTLASDTYACGSALPKLTTAQATEKFIAQFKYKRYHEQCEAISVTFGQLLSVENAQILSDDKSNLIFRFKAHYEKTDDVSEIRVYTNTANQVTDLIYKPIWYDKYFAADEKPPLRKIEADASDKAHALEFATATFTCKKESFLKLTPENATRRLQNSLTNEKLENFCNQLGKQFGKLAKLDLTEILCDDYRIIYRYKAKFSNSDEVLDCRVYTNMQHLFAGIYCEDIWSDQFYEDGHVPKKTK